MKRFVPLAFVIAALPLGGCTVNAIDTAAHQSVLNSARFRQIICIDGVEYVAFPGKESWSVAPHFKPDGTLFTCSDSAPTLR